MAYWDKKTETTTNKVSGRASGGFWKEEEPEVKESPKNGDNIDFKALDDLEKDMQDTANDVLDEVQGIADSIKRQKAQAKDMLSSGYWFAVCFNNDKQKQQFLSALGYNPSWTFIQGDDFARKVGVSYKEPNHDYSKERRVNQQYKARARQITGFKPAD